MSNDIHFDLNMLEFRLSVSCGSFYWTICVNDLLIHQDMEMLVQLAVLDWVKNNSKLRTRMELLGMFDFLWILY